MAEDPLLVSYYQQFMTWWVMKPMRTRIQTYGFPTRG